jgi:5S rRNA maturation endonuclease (ribonuclease M5)
MFERVVTVVNYRERERFVRLLKVIEKLIEDNATSPIVVEGKRDLQSLRKLEVSGEILLLNTGETMLAFCERLARTYDRVILLTDWDKKGGALAERIRTNLSDSRIDLDLDFRRKIALGVKKGINRVELLASYVESKRKEFKL